MKRWIVWLFFLPVIAKAEPGLDNCRVLALSVADARAVVNCDAVLKALSPGQVLGNGR